jgi:hypothetical protein
MTPPTIVDTRAATVGGVTTFAVDAREIAPDAVKRVIVVYKTPQSGQWSSLDLVQGTGTNTWTSSAAATGQIQYVVYAIDGAGNVAVSTNKGDFHHTVSIAATSGLTLTVSGVQGGGGWYRSASVAVAGAQGVQFTTSVDGAAAQPYGGPVALSGTGPHTIVAHGSDGSAGETLVALDNDPPVATISSPADGALFLKGQPVAAQYLCLDAGSGVASCTGPVTNGTNIDTSSAGVHVFQVASTDIAGNSGGGSVSYTVSTQCYGNLSCDGLPDTYKLAHPCLAPPNYPLTQNIASLDSDNDGLTNLQEYQYGTDPCNPYTAGDGYTDGEHVALGKNPLLYCAIMRADVNHDGMVNLLDLSLLAAYYLQTIPPAPARYDQNGDNTINIIDFAEMATVFEKSVTACP